MRRSCAAMVCALFVASCSGDPDPVSPPSDASTETAPGDPPSFPAGYAATYTEVRDCRQSNEHDLHRVRILADPAALAPYRDRKAPFPTGAIVLKEEYEFDDVTCSGPILQWTVMKRVAPKTAPELLDWQWEQVDAKRNVVSKNAVRCAGCHAGCTPEADGYENTCAVP